MTAVNINISFLYWQRRSAICLIKVQFYTFYLQSCFDIQYCENVTTKLFVCRLVYSFDTSHTARFLEQVSQTIDLLNY